jgi:hypothetical protein
MRERFAERLLRAIVPLFVGVTLLLFTGCIRSLHDAAIPGEYYTSGTWGESTLILTEQGTFQQSLHMIGGGRVKKSGVWRMLAPDESHNRRSIEFSPFFSMEEDILGDSLDNATYSIYAFGLSGVWIETDDDAHIRYKKIGNVFF